MVAFAVKGRRQEFGIRVALGAGGHRIASLVLRYAGSIILLGTLAGLRARTCAIACAVPTWKAMRVNPIDTLQGR